MSMRTPRKQTVKRPNVRRLKIQPKIRFNKYSQKEVPEIKLTGNWLDKLGFEPNQQVNIATLPGLLIIYLERE